MKNIYYLLAVAVLGLSACQKEPGLQNTVPASTKQTLNITLQAADYGKLASGYPKTTFSFDDVTDANTYIPQILNAEYLIAANGSVANVTYTVSSLYFKPDPDSLYSDAAYTLTKADYLLLTGNKYDDFSLSQMLEWMQEDTSVYTHPVNNQLALVTFTPYPSTLTPPPPYSYLNFNGTWRQIYTIQPAQYTAVGLGKYDQFSTSNTEASLVTTFDFFIKNDITIMDTVKKNDIIFVSFGYYNGGNYQRVKPLQYNGTDFIAPYTTTASGTYVKANGAWKPQPIITHTLTSADISLIAASTTTGASASLLSNLGSYGDFSTSWTPAELDAAFILVLQKDYPTPVVGTNYQVVYLAYVGGSDVSSTYTFQWNGTSWAGLQ